MLRNGSALCEIDGRLHCRNGRDDATMLIGLRDLLRPGEAVDASPDKLFVRTSDARDVPLGLYFYRLTPERTMGAFGDERLAMLVLHQPGHHLDLDPFVVAAAFDLSPAEARVAVRTARGDSPADISRLHGVSHSTVRTQLQSVFAKTGAARQSELVSILSALPMAALGLRSS